MAKSQLPLPDFGRPPVNEVVLSVQFEPLGPLLSYHLGEFWQSIRSKYPKAEVHPPIDSTFERLGPPIFRPPGVQIEFAQAPLASRLWLLNEGGTELMQIQQDRFVHNWRKVLGDEAYPRYEHVRDGFRDELVAFAHFATSHNFGEIRPNQCEVTYINHIDCAAEARAHGDPAEVLRVLSRDQTYGALPRPESSQFAAKYLIETDDDAGRKTVGRLHVDFVPVYTVKDNRPIFVLNLMARGVPLGEGIEGAMRFLDLGRETIVRGFADITTSTMHRVWERKDA